MVQGKKATQTHITQTEILKEQTLLPEYFAAEFVTFCGRETICSASYLDDIDFHVEFYSMRISKIHYIYSLVALARNKNIAFYASNAFLHLNLPSFRDEMDIKTWTSIPTSLGLFQEFVNINLLKTHPALSGLKIILVQAFPFQTQPSIN